MSKKERKEFNRQAAELSEQQLDDVSGGYGTYYASDGTVLVFGIDKKTKQETAASYWDSEPGKAAEEAEKWAKDNLMKDPKIRRIF